MPALQRYFDAERQRRGWSVREVADRSHISLSKAYAIIKGDDNVETETFENIAVAFGMTPAELFAALGKGTADEHPQRITVQALLRDVPDDDLGTVERIVRTFARAKSRGKSNAQTRRRHVSTRSAGDENGSDNSLTVGYHRLRPALALAVR